MITGLILSENHKPSSQKQKEQTFWEKKCDSQENHLNLESLWFWKWTLTIFYVILKLHKQIDKQCWGAGYFFYRIRLPLFFYGSSSLLKRPGSPLRIRLLNTADKYFQFKVGGPFNLRTRPLLIFFILNIYYFYWNKRPCF